MTINGTAVVTGGANGIGAACCRLLATSGANVIVLDRDLTLAEQIARELGGRAYQADVADEESLRSCAARIEQAGPVDILVNSAGIVQGPSKPARLSMSRWDDIIRVDQRGVYLACLVFGAGMVQRRRGSIVNIGSIAGMRSLPLHAYAPAKAAVIAMTECLAAEWGPSNVRVNCVSPGFTRTPAFQAAIDSRKADASKMIEHAALGRLVETSEVAEAVAFLAWPLRQE